MNNILMTGTEGCVGSRLKEVFNERGYDVTEFAGDIRYPGAWENYKTMKWDGLIHLAAIAGVRRSFKEPEMYYDNNVNGTIEALKFADKFCNKMLYASSSNAYEWWGNPYAATKKMCEVAATDYNAKGMRFHTVWPGREDMLYRNLQKGNVTYINQNHYRDYIHREDLCKGIFTIYQNYGTIEEKVLDIGTGHPVHVASVAKIMGFDGEYRSENPQGERVHTKANIEYLLKLGWTPERNILDVNSHTE